jgi:hypothetical protein
VSKESFKTCLKYKAPSSETCHDTGLLPYGDSEDSDREGHEVDRSSSEKAGYSQAKTATLQAV